MVKLNHKIDDFALRHGQVTGTHPEKMLGATSGSIAQVNDPCQTCFAPLTLHSLAENACPVCCHVLYIDAKATTQQA